MEVLQCDGCDFRAESYDDLKTHIQEVHTVFLQPADADESDSLKDEDEEEEEEEECEDERDREDKDYTPLKSGMSMLTTFIQMLQLIVLRVRKYIDFCCNDLLSAAVIRSKIIVYFIVNHINLELLLVYWKS